MIGVAEFFGAFMLWTLWSYGVHRLAHVHHKKNPLWHMHKPHHRNNYNLPRPLIENWKVFLLWFGDFKKTADVWVVFTLPSIALAALIGGGAWFLPIFHYLYEVFLADQIFEHNPKIKGKITRYVACGAYHLHHHKKFTANYGFFLTFWDKLFNTADYGYASKEKS